MPKVNLEVLRSVQNALEDYKKTVSDTALSPRSKETYILHAEHFVRWLDNDFERGQPWRSRARMFGAGL